MKAPSILVATLGGQPQVITFTLDLLRARGERIDQVALIYFANSPRYKKAFRVLAEAFSGDIYMGESCHLRSVPIRLNEDIISSARTPEEVNAVHKTISTLLDKLKREGYRIHLSLSGGRRTMAILASSIAMQYLDSADRIWHIYTSDSIRAEADEGRLLHIPRNEGIELIAIPFMAWRTYFPGIERLMGTRANLGLLSAKEREACKKTWEALTPRQRDSLRAIAETASRREAAQKIHIAVTTLDSHKTKIIRLCQHHWQGENIDIHFLREKFSLFLAG